VLNDLGVVHKAQARFDDAGLVYRRALAISAQAEDTDAAALATLYHNLGGLEHARGRYAVGEPFARRALEIRRGLLGPDHPQVAAAAAALHRSALQQPEQPRRAAPQAGP